MVLHPAPPWSSYLEAGAACDISTAALPQCEAPSAAAFILAGSAAAASALARSLTLLLLLLRLSLDRSLAQLLLLLSPSLMLLLCSD